MYPNDIVWYVHVLFYLPYSYVLNSAIFYQVLKYEFVTEYDKSIGVLWLLTACIFELLIMLLCNSQM